MTHPTPMPIDLNQLRSTFCFGVAGNFAGHLEQAGEAADFVNVDAAAALPKGIFPWYVPDAGGRLGAFPISSTQLAIPDAGADAAPLRIQVEPELAVLCDVVRRADGLVEQLVPRWAGAFDDCSLRRPNARKISDKKNWGTASKGLATHGFTVTSLARDGELASMRLASFLRRGDETHPYGVDSEVATYTLFGEPLLDWLVDRLRTQRDTGDTPLEDVGAMLAACPEVSSALVGVGATRYEPYGETTFVEAGDEAIVVLYDAAVHTPDAVEQLVTERRDDELHAASVLRRLARA